MVARRRGTLVLARLALVLAVVLALVLPTAVAARPSGAERRAPRATQRVRIVDFAYRPRSVTVPRGTRVRWTNAGNVAHTSTSSRGFWDSGLLDPGEAYSRKFRRAGTFRYTCTVHPAMRGRIVVT